MNDSSTGMNDHQDLFEGGESKSSSSQESGLCSTMLAIDESMGSLEELSENLHHHLDSHIDHTSVLHYELDLLQSQLAEKNRLIATQQVTIKQLQDALKTIQKECGDIKKRTDLELTGLNSLSFNVRLMVHVINLCCREVACKNETIDILQSDLIECQQQYANCLEKVMNQNRLLSEINEDDNLLIQKIAHLESKLIKTNHSVATQTTNQKFEPHTTDDYQQSSRTCRTSLSPIFASSHFHRDGGTRLRSFYERIPNNRDEVSSPQFGGDIGRQSSPHSRPSEVSWSPQFQELLTEIRQIQTLLQSSKQEPVRPETLSSSTKPYAVSSEDMARFWNTIAEERKQWLELNHLVRQIELDVLEVKTQVQSCKIRLQAEQPQQFQRGCTCLPSKTCMGSRSDMPKTAPPHIYPVLPYPKPTQDSLFTLV